MAKDSVAQDDALLRALVILLAQDRDERVAGETAAKRTELVLAESGFSSAQIATILGRNAEAVRSVIRRAAEKSSKP
jgi:DNA-directed RNA polymerase specialized sigma24 family protein